MAKRNPSQASGQAPAPTKNIKRKAKKPRAIEIGERVVGAIGKLNPFD